jgi:hypothetical protein
MSWKTFLPIFAVLIFGVLLAHAMTMKEYLSTPKRGELKQQTPPTKQETLTPISKVTFVASPKWYLLKAKALDGDTLVFRKYSFALDGEMTNEKNIVDFGCQKNARNWDYLVFHFPDWASFGLEKNSWNPHLRINVALNELSLTFDADAEFKNNSLFIDLNEPQHENLFKLMAASEITIDYGFSDARQKIHQADRTPDGKGNVTGFIDDMVRQLVSPGVRGGKVVSFDNDGVLKACMAYRRNGRLPQ